MNNIEILATTINPFTSQQNIKEEKIKLTLFVNSRDGLIKTFDRALIKATKEMRSKNVNFFEYEEIERKALIIKTLKTTHKWKVDYILKTKTFINK